MYLGLDLGTSGLRAVLADGEGRVIAASEASLSVQHPHHGWSEQDPTDWVRALHDVVADLSNSHTSALGKVQAIGLAGHMHGAVVLDRADQVLRPCILWNDTRAARQATQLDETPGVRDISGNIAFPGFTAPKLMWMADHEPDLFRRIGKVMLPKDFLRLYLTGEHVSDLSDAAGTSWCDVAERRWSEALLSASGMRADQMPGLVEGSAISGQLRAVAADAMGMSAGIPVVGGGADNAAAACGAGCVSDGQAFVSLGTSGVILAAREACTPAPASAVHTFCHALPDRWYQMGVILAATDALNWLGQTLNETPSDLAARLPERPSAVSGLHFLPYISGERTPHNDAAIRGAFVGLDVTHDRADLVAAVMQGVGFALRDVLEALRSAGTQVDHLLALGGGTRSPYWLNALASILGLPLTRPAAGELGAGMGAVRLAMVGAGHPVQDAMAPPEIAETLEPDPTLIAPYEAAYAQYRALYPNIKAALS